MPDLPPGEERLRALLRHVSDTVTVFDANGDISWLSGGGTPTLGRTDEEWAGENSWNHLHPDDRLAMAGKLAVAVGGWNPRARPASQAPAPTPAPTGAAEGSRA
jgi:PAS domain-containing protein